MTQADEPTQAISASEGQSAPPAMPAPDARRTLVGRPPADAAPPGQTRRSLVGQPPADANGESEPGRTLVGRPAADTVPAQAPAPAAAAPEAARGAVSGPDAPTAPVVARPPVDDDKPERQREVRTEDGPRAGHTNTILDVPGIRAGHATRRDAGWLTGTTVVLPPSDGAVAGVDVRGGGPGTRETDLLDPRNLVERVHAVVLTGGSAFGLASVDGVMSRLFEAGVGYPMGGPGEVVPIVPAAVIFDLGRGGVFGNRPDALAGEAAYDAAVASAAHGNLRLGVIGAGTGAKAGGLKGGLGSASTVLADGTTIGALVVVNPAGSTVDPATGELYGQRYCLPGDTPPMRTPDDAEVRAALEAGHQASNGLPMPVGLATTIAVIATDAVLTKAQCQKVAGVAHDGLARAIRPVHSMFDGDTVFTLATGSGSTPDPIAFHELLQYAADTLTRAVVRGMLAAETVSSPAGTWRSYRDGFRSAFA